MQPDTRITALSPGLLDDIRLNWLGDASASNEDSSRRIRACQAAAHALGTDMQRQLARSETVLSSEDERHHALVLGYANGRAEALLRDSGECSRWAIELISLSALLVVLGPAWDEDALCGQGQRLWCQKHPGYIAGIRAAQEDHRRVVDGQPACGLAKCVAERQVAQAVAVRNVSRMNIL